MKKYLFINQYNDETVDFFDPNAVKTLNKALLLTYYKLQYWDIPKQYLCPPIPGRADYIHNLADLLACLYQDKIPSKINCLDIGVGANCIYPIIGASTYDWNFVASDIDPISIKNAKNIVDKNDILKYKIELRLQKHSKNIFEGVIQKRDFFDITICNPPFHSSAIEASNTSNRKVNNLTKNSNRTLTINRQYNEIKSNLNFAGQSNELWCKGGEVQFVTNMIIESKNFAKSCLYFTSLISKSENLNVFYKLLKKLEVQEYNTIEMSHGNKISRILVWTFMNQSDKIKWINQRC